MSSAFEVKASFKLGIIGGGQLARMSSYQAFRMGMQVGAVCSPSGTDPMEQVTPHIFRGDVSGYETLMELAKWADVITLENEFLDADVLARVQKDSGTPVYPSPETFRLIENKRIEKETFSDAGIPVARFMVVSGDDDLKKAGAKLGWPYVLKSSKGGYDGYGNAMVANQDEARRGFDKLGGNAGREVIAEETISFVKELAVMVARNEHGAVAYPCVETIQENHICTRVITPARVDRDLREQCERLAIKAAEAIDGKGMFGFEFFLTEEGELLLNESAPRPHNSGHYSIEACTASQFENHVRAVCGLPLAEPNMRSNAAVMINMLGIGSGDAVLSCSERPDTDNEEVHIHSYGKLQCRDGRKMGHFTVMGENPDAALERALKLESIIQIKGR
ncbi:MAG: 5-(carboxyamino)imidazole ribonucleotide synthase [Balneolia bacterium]|nr:5-(carboxyamino)imidazole ribonucleotide synthase [Balneolia bacterium]